MADFTIRLVADNVREWDSKFGPMKSYRVNLDGPNGPVQNVELAQKASSPAPSQGQSLQGHVETTEYGPKFKKDRQQGGGFRGRDPVENARIQRQHSQEMALRFLTLKVQLGQFPDSLNDLKPADLRPFINWFDEDATAATPPPAKPPVRDTTVRTGRSDLPVPEVPAPVPVGNDVPFS